MKTKNTVSTYALTTDEQGSKALDIQQNILADATYKQIIKAGLSSGMHAWEYGCGNGAITCTLSEIVGPTGSVTAVDQSKEQLDRVLSTATNKGLSNVITRQENLDTFVPPIHKADFVFGRYILMHLQNPKNILENIHARLLKPNGIALFGEPSWDKTYFEGENEDDLLRFREAVIQLGQTKGVDYNFGEKLRSAMLAQNFKVVQEENVTFSCFGKNFVDLWSIRLKELSPELIDKKCASTQDVDRWFSIAEKLNKNPANTAMHAPMYYVSGMV
ncbi:MAG TPA: hypothetical protein DIC42_03280 [Holosporales bacterium]|nr:hypothetical protein [Holosporales bacterium]